VCTGWGIIVLVLDTARSGMGSGLEHGVSNNGDEHLKKGLNIL
jgi:hypothetical protein